MAEILAFDPARRTSAQAIADLAALGYLNEDQHTLDATYGKGRFWTKWRPHDLVTNDIDGNRGAQWCRDYRNLPELWGAPPRFDVVVFDPPFKLNGTGGSHPSDEAYGVATPYISMAELFNGIRQGLDECTRVVKRGGLILYKCQDQVSGGKRRWTTKRTGWETPAFDLPHIVDLVDELYIVGYRKQPGDRECRRCGGTGNELLGLYRKCSDCGGVGRLPIEQRHSRSNVSVLQVYRRCS